MSAIQIKICGVTSVEDAELCAEAGVDMIGLNFCRQSPRYLSTDRAREITESVAAAIKTVGVFADAGADEIRKVVSETGIKVVQLHGSESPDFSAELSDEFEIIRALRAGPDFRPASVAKYPGCTILLDGYDSSRLGGTGEVFDWNVAREVRTLATRLILAGGLSPENVADAIATVKPDGVDACSRLEREPGIKDPARVREFVRAVKGQSS